MLPVITDVFYLVMVCFLYGASAIVMWVLMKDHAQLKEIYKKRELEYTYIFDLDGTLVDSSIDIIGSLARAYAECGFTGDRGVIVPKTCIGGKIKDIINELTPKISDSNKARVETCFRNNYDNCGHHNTKLYPEVKEVLENYEGRCYLVTNKPRKATFEIINKFGLKFVDIACATTGKTKGLLLREMIKKHKLKNCIYVGDTPADKKAARYAKVKSVLVTYGFCDIIKLPNVLDGCDYSVNSLTELYDHK